MVTTIAGDNVCCDSGEIGHFSLASQNIRQFTMENELNVPENLHKILRVQTNCPTATTSVYQDKVTVKGEVNADIFYTVTDSPQIKRHTQTFAYNQIVDMKGIKENHIPCTDITVCGFSVSQNQDSKKYMATATVQIDATAFSKQNVIAVKDAFSRGFEYDRTQQETLCDTNMYHIDKTVLLQITETVPDSYDICDVILEITPAKSYFEINKTTVKAKVTANIIATNGQNKYECFAKTEDVVLEWLENCGQFDEICIKLSAVGCTYTRTGDEMQINANILVQGFVIEKQAFGLLKTFEEKEDKPQQTDAEALVVYYASKGERVFDIAKSHNADPREIAEENALQTDVLTVGQMLFIPAFTE